LKSPFPAALALRYEAIEVLETGGFGTVYRARQIDLDRQVAIKLMNPAALDDPDQRSRFHDEAIMTASLSHPNVVKLLDFGFEEDLPWAVFEYVSGVTLRARLLTGPVPVSETIETLVQIASGLSAAHDRGILHRDIKPENVVLSTDGSCRVIDFGIARWDSQRHVRTRTWIILGTPEYLPPETLEGKDPTPASDQYSLGILAFELLTGERPYSSANLIQIVDMHLRAPVPNPRDLRGGIPTWLAEIVVTLLAKKPEDRFRDMHHLMTELTSGGDRGLTQDREERAATQPIATSPATGSTLELPRPSSGSSPDREGADHSFAPRRITTLTGSVSLLGFLVILITVGSFWIGSRIDDDTPAPMDDSGSARDTDSMERARPAMPKTSNFPVGGLLEEPANIRSDLRRYLDDLKDRTTKSVVHPEFQEIVDLRQIGLAENLKIDPQRVRTFLKHMEASAERLRGKGSGPGIDEQWIELGECIEEANILIEEGGHQPGTWSGPEVLSKESLRESLDDILERLGAEPTSVPALVAQRLARIEVETRRGSLAGLEALRERVRFVVWLATEHKTWAGTSLGQAIRIRYASEIGRAAMTRPGYTVGLTPVLEATIAEIPNQVFGLVSELVQTPVEIRVGSPEFTAMVQAMSLWGLCDDRDNRVGADSRLEQGLSVILESQVRAWVRSVQGARTGRDLAWTSFRRKIIEKIDKHCCGNRLQRTGRLDIWTREIPIDGFIGAGPARRLDRLLDRSVRLKGPRLSNAIEAHAVKFLASFEEAARDMGVSISRTNSVDWPGVNEVLQEMDLIEEEIEHLGKISTPAWMNLADLSCQILGYLGRDSRLRDGVDEKAAKAAKAIEQRARVRSVSPDPFRRASGLLVLSRLARTRDSILTGTASQNIQDFEIFLELDERAPEWRKTTEGRGELSRRISDIYRSIFRHEGFLGVEEARRCLEASRRLVGVILILVQNALAAPAWSMR